ncbi:MAG: exopolysaccharide biosynthesis polyprenyl glycosylphosphotransferase [Lachnospiraceae bacterium]|nr:exopolysaccharide biosynthesis polyprenyl glycosylphosphotransferase [Lachnospiraceae bacterium]
MKPAETVKRTVILLWSLLGVLIMTGMYIYTWYFVYNNVDHKLVWHVKLYLKGHILMGIIYLVLLFFFVSTFGGMKIGYLKPMDVFFSQLFGIAIVDAISYGQISLMEVRLVKAYPMWLLLFAQLIFSLCWCLAGNMLYRVFFPPRKLLLIYGDHDTGSIRSKFASRKDKYDIVALKYMSEEGIYDDMISSEYDGVVLWDVPATVRNKMLKYMYAHNIRVYMMPKISDVIIKGSDPLHLFDTPIYLTREYSLKVEQRFAKRCIDIVCALLLAVLTSPIMLITAIVIFCYDRGPVLYKQVRCTINGRQFKIMKFRSMRVDAEKDGVARLATKNDSRITPIGRFIRAVRIDELPQLFNILKGDMSFIGPRPERPEIIEQYIEEIPEFAFRMKVKAGLAGYAQVYGKYNTTPYDKLKLDLSYIENYSVWLDLKLMLLTLKILFTPDATEGVDEDKTTAAG